MKTSRHTPWLYMAPMLLLLGFTFAYPLISIFNFSTRRIRGATGPFIGLENFRQVFKDDVFQLSAAHNATLLLAVPIMLIIAIFLAVILYEGVRGWRVYRAILFFPFILAVPVVGVVFSNLLQLNGIVNSLLRAVGLDFLALDWLGNPDLALWTIMGVIIWREVGFGIVLFLARLLSLNEQLLEAAEIDGAGWWQRLWYVIIPQLKNVIEFYLVIAVITMLAWIFSYMFVMTRGGPANATQILELYIFRFAFRNNLPGIASAVAVILFLVTLLLIIPLFRWRAQSEGEELV